MNSRSGFTLIELLVIISIIGILSGVVITFVQGAKYRAGDAAVRQNLAQLRAALDLVPPSVFSSYNPINPAAPCLDGNGKVPVSGNIGLSVLGHATVRPIIEAAAHAAGINNASLNASCMASDTWPPVWAVAIKLRSSPTDWWCVDSETNSKLVQVSGFVITEPINIVTMACN